MRGTPLLVRGHRAVRMGPLKPPAVPRPPLVLIGGTAQWIDSWTGQMTALARERQVLLYETRGQGGATSSLDVSRCDLAQQAEDFAAVVEAGLDECLLNAPIDVCGFSFGGRVALAAAAAGNGPRIRRLCLTGVSADRGHGGRLALHSWKASLAAEDLCGFAWRLILDTHSSAYLAEHEAQVPGWVQAIVEANSSAGLRALVEQTHTEEADDRHHPRVMAARTRAAGVVEAGLVIAGTDDIMAPPDASRMLAEEGGWQFREVAGAAHAVPIEQAVAWRRAVLGFLDAPPK